MSGMETHDGRTVWRRSSDSTLGTAYRRQQAGREFVGNGSVYARNTSLVIADGDPVTFMLDIIWTANPTQNESICSLGSARFGLWIDSGLNLRFWVIAQNSGPYYLPTINERFVAVGVYEGGASKPEFFINGVSIGTWPFDVTITAMSGWGVLHRGSGNGIVSDRSVLRSGLWNRALSLEEITSLTNGVELLPTNCIHYANFESPTDNIATTLLDSSGNGNHLTVSNGYAGMLADTASGVCDLNELGWTDGTGSNGAAVGVRIPADRSNPTQDVYGNALQFSGRCEAAADVTGVSCLVSNGSAYAQSSSIVPIDPTTGDLTASFHYTRTAANSDGAAKPLSHSQSGASGWQVFATSTNVRIYVYTASGQVISSITDTADFRDVPVRCDLSYTVSTGEATITLTRLTDGYSETDSTIGFPGETISTPGETLRIMFGCGAGWTVWGAAYNGYSLPVCEGGGNLIHAVGTPAVESLTMVNPYVGQWGTTDTATSHVQEVGAEWRMAGDLVGALGPMVDSTILHSDFAALGVAGFRFKLLPITISPSGAVCGAREGTKRCMVRSTKYFGTSPALYVELNSADIDNNVCVNMFDVLQESEFEIRANAPLGSGSETEYSAWCNGQLEPDSPRTLTTSESIPVTFGVWGINGDLTVNQDGEIKDFELIDVDGNTIRHWPLNDGVDARWRARSYAQPDVYHTATAPVPLSSSGSFWFAEWYRCDTTAQTWHGLVYAGGRINVYVANATGNATVLSEDGAVAAIPLTGAMDEWCLLFYERNPTSGQSAWLWSPSNGWVSGTYNDRLQTFTELTVEVGRYSTAGDRTLTGGIPAVMAGTGYTASLDDIRLALYNDGRGIIRGELTDQQRQDFGIVLESYGDELSGDRKSVTGPDMTAVGSPGSVDGPRAAQARELVNGVPAIISGTVDRPHVPLASGATGDWMRSRETLNYQQTAGLTPWLQATDGTNAAPISREFADATIINGKDKRAYEIMEADQIRDAMHYRDAITTEEHNNLLNWQDARQ